MRFDPPLYLDACAAAPPAAEVLATMAQLQDRAWANPSSLHPAGIAAATLLERSRQHLLELLGASSGQLIFTSGGTEADNLALFGICRAQPPGRLLHSPLDHPAVSAAAAQLAKEGWQVEQVPVDPEGCIDLQRLPALLSPPTRLLSIAWASSELGTLQPLAAIGELCRAAGVLLHADAVQVVGQLPFQLDQLPLDLLSLSAHKFQGPRGIGALWLRSGLQLQPQLLGGGQEGGLRSGTESPLLAAGLVRALELRLQQLPELADRLAAMRDQLRSSLTALAGVRSSGCWRPGGRLPHHLSLLLSNAEGLPISGRALVRALARHGVELSSGSACSSGTDLPSPSLLALGLTPAQACSGLRLSLGPWINPSQLPQLPSLLESVLQQVGAQAQP